MNGVDVLLAVAGTLVTLLTLAGMVLLVPRGVVEVHAEGTDGHGSNLSPLPARRPPRLTDRKGEVDLRAERHDAGDGRIHGRG
jgi:hypothetical protein